MAQVRWEDIPTVWGWGAPFPDWNGEKMLSGSLPALVHRSLRWTVTTNMASDVMLLHPDFATLIS